MLKNEIDKLKYALLESTGDEVDPRMLPNDSVWGTLRYVTSEDDDTLELTSGTSLKGTLYNTTYASLVKHFGEPKWTTYTRNDEPDIFCEWTIDFFDGVMASIYDWRIGGVHPKDNTEWRVGGKSTDAYHKVQLVLEGKGKRG